MTESRPSGKEIYENLNSLFSRPETRRTELSRGIATDRFQHETRPESKSHQTEERKDPSPSSSGRNRDPKDGNPYRPYLTIDTGDDDVVHLVDSSVQERGIETTLDGKWFEETLATSPPPAEPPNTHSYCEICRSETCGHKTITGTEVFILDRKPVTVFVNERDQRGEIRRMAIPGKVTIYKSAEPKTRIRRFVRENRGWLGLASAALLGTFGALAWWRRRGSGASNEK